MVSEPIDMTALSIMALGVFLILGVPTVAIWLAVMA